MAEDPTFYIELEPRQGLRRPMSYSDSFIRNMEPTDVVFLQAKNQRENIQFQNIKENYYIDFVLRLLFHVSLISIFETVFFFVYVSALEDNGILSIVNGYIDDLTDSCIDLTSQQKIFIQEILVRVNATNIIDYGNASQQVRLAYNKTLYNQAWYYMICFVSLFLTMSSILYCKGYRVNYKIVVLENIAMIILLAVYELMFFQTIIFQYQSIGVPEIDKNFIQQIEWKCS